ncbi:MAG: hypothetical protein J2P32_01625 [Actinobacteria bacterium]|nr:hypothetical protein [Actinomycetota bacterium]
MIKIRYRPLPEGLHAEAQAQGRHTIVYLRPGLSSEQRRDALRRARQTARMGHGPQLPAPALAWALGVDRVTGTLRTTFAAVRCHPLGATMIVAVLAGAVVTYSLFVTVSVRYLYPRAQGGRPPVPTVTEPAGQGSAGGSPGHSPSGSPGGSGGSSRAVTPREVSTPVASSPSAANPAPRPSPSPTARSRPSPAASGPSPSPSPSPTSTALCVNVGTLGVCVKL